MFKKRCIHHVLKSHMHAYTLALCRVAAVVGLLPRRLQARGRRMVAVWRCTLPSPGHDVHALPLPHSPFQYIAFVSD